MVAHSWFVCLDYYNMTTYRLWDHWWLMVELLVLVVVALRYLIIEIQTISSWKIMHLSIYTGLKNNVIIYNMADNKTLNYWFTLCKLIITKKCVIPGCCLCADEEKGLKFFLRTLRLEVGFVFTLFWEIFQKDYTPAQCRTYVVAGSMHPCSYFSTRGVAGLAVSAVVPVDEWSDQCAWTVSPKLHSFCPCDCRIDSVQPRVACRYGSTC